VNLVGRASTSNVEVQRVLDTGPLPASPPAFNRLRISLAQALERKGTEMTSTETTRPSKSAGTESQRPTWPLIYTARAFFGRPYPLPPWLAAQGK
jgi:hypothetical protein